MVDLYPPDRNESPLSPGGHVVSVDEDDVDLDTGGKRLIGNGNICVGTLAQ